VLRGRRALSSEFWILNSGFSLTEVMFAVIVLGIGFIMVAAMFPVSISQSRLTVEETAAAGIARSAMAATSRLAENGDSPPVTPAPTNWGQLFPPTDLYKVPPTSSGTSAMNIATFSVAKRQQVTIPGKVLSFNDIRLDDGTIAGNPRYRSNLWNAFKGSFILPSDNRYAWVALYRRDVTYYNNTDAQIDVTSQAALNQLIAIQSPFAQVYFIPVAVRNRTLYDNTVSATNLDLQATNPNLQPRLVQVEIVPEPRAYGGYVLNMVRRTLGPPFPVETAVEGAYLVISDDRILFPKVTDPATGIATNVNGGRMNGRIFRLGSRRPDLDSGGTTTGRIAWELAPGFEFKRDPGANGLLWNQASNNSDSDDIVAIGNTAVIPNQNSQTRSGTAAFAFLIGRNPTGTGAYEGPAQDIAAYVTFVKVN